AAHDFGYVSAGGLLARTAAALDSMAALDRHEGHFYNWYDTRSGKPLAPLYISAVDSGNLAGHLMTLCPGLVALADAPVVDSRWFEGLGDTVRTLGEAMGAEAPAALAHLRADLETAYDSRPATPGLATQWLARIETGIEALAASIAPSPGSDTAFWLDALERQCRALLEEIAVLGLAT